MAWELESLSWIQDHRIEIMNPIMKFFSFLGNKGWFWIVLALVLLAMNRTRRTGIEMAAAMLLMFIVGNLLLKHIQSSSVQAKSPRSVTTEASPAGSSARKA